MSKTGEDRVTCERLLHRYGVFPEESLMVGNSVGSDVLPVVAIGGRAVHVPYEITWEHEAVEGDFPEVVGRLTRLFELLEAGTAPKEEDLT